jgi:hypothetical protein
MLKSYFLPKGFQAEDGFILPVQLNNNERKQVHFNVALSVAVIL